MISKRKIFPRFINKSLGWVWQKGCIGPESSMEVRNLNIFCNQSTLTGFGLFKIKTSFFKTLTLIAVLIISFGCAIGSKEVVKQKPAFENTMNNPKSEILITKVEISSANQIFITGIPTPTSPDKDKEDFPITWSSFTASDPYCLVIDILGASFDHSVKEQIIKDRTALIKRITPITKNQELPNTCRLEIELNREVPYHIIGEKGKLIITFESTEQTSLNTIDENSQTNLPEPEKPIEINNLKDDQKVELEPAQKVLDLRYETIKNHTKVTIVADGKLNYKLFTLPNPPRLVIDLLDVNHSLLHKEISLENAYLWSIRSSQFALIPRKITRVVFDLKSSDSENLPFSYNIQNCQEGLAVIFGSEPSSLSESNSEPKSTITEKSETFENKEPLPASSSENQIITEESPPPRTTNLDPTTAPIDHPDSETSSDSPSVELDDNIKISENIHQEKPKLLTEDNSTDKFPTINPKSETQPAILASSEKSPDTTWKPTDKQIDQTSLDYYGGPEKYVGEPVSLNFKNADILDVFRVIAEIAGLNIVVEPGIEGFITVTLNNVPWDQALEVILKNNKLGQIREDNIIRIATMKTITDMEKQALEAKEARRLAEDVQEAIFYLSYARAQDLAPLLRETISKRKDAFIQVDERTNSLLISDIPEKLASFTRLIKAFDEPTKQVMIEARIVETTRNFARELGVQWGLEAIADANHGNTTNYNFPNNFSLGGGDLTGDGSGAGASGRNWNVNAPTQTSYGSLGMTFGNILNSVNLDVALSAMEDQGKGKVLSSPKITTQNNLSAEIFSGSMIPYRTISESGTKTDFVNAGIKLTVIPQITPDGRVSMRIEINKDEPDWSNRVDNTPAITQKSAKTTILIKDGDTTVIGGLYKISESNEENQVPWFSQIPGLGWLFKNSIKSSSNEELLIFITPHISHEEI